MNNTFDQFLARGPWPSSAYIQYPDFDSLYIRKSDVYVILKGVCYRCSKVITLARLMAKNPGHGAFTRLLDDLVKQDFAVIVECVHTPRFIQGLLRMGFEQLDVDPPSFLFNHKGHLLEAKA